MDLVPWHLVLECMKFIAVCKLAVAMILASTITRICSASIAALSPEALPNFTDGASVATQTIEARTAQLKPLAALAGRLDLLVAHLPKPDAAAGADALELPSPEVPFVLPCMPTHSAISDRVGVKAGCMMLMIL